MASLPAAGLTPEHLVGIYRQMLLIRHFEAALKDLHARRNSGGSARLYRRSSRGRGCLHGAAARRIHYQHTPRAWASDGYCHGKGGEIHIADFELGMLGANGIVSGGLRLATGTARSA